MRQRLMTMMALIGMLGLAPSVLAQKDCELERLRGQMCDENETSTRSAALPRREQQRRRIAPVLRRQVWPPVYKKPPRVEYVAMEPFPRQWHSLYGESLFLQAGSKGLFFGRSDRAGDKRMLQQEMNWDATYETFWMSIGTSTVIAKIDRRKKVLRFKGLDGGTIEFHPKSKLASLLPPIPVRP